MYYLSQCLLLIIVFVYYVVCDMMLVNYFAGLTMHWHGVVQKGSNLMDGVAYVNQCPIAAGTSFTYK